LRIMAMTGIPFVGPWTVPNMHHEQNL